MSHAAHHKAAFFRQSGWLMIANVLTGGLMWGVHFVAGKRISEAEYGTVVKMLAVTILIPAIPLQTVLARETAAALALHQERALAGMLRKLSAALCGLWLVVTAVALWFQPVILTEWKVAQPLSLWLLLAAVLGMLLLPVFWGALQGAQNFFWLGGSMILNGAGRLLLAALAVLCIACTAASVMAGVVAGLVVATALAIWQTQPLWAAPAEPFHWRTLLRQMLPAMIGFTACQFLFSADTIFVGAFFSADDTGFYAAAGTLSRALIWLVLPLATVMFPKLVHSAARSEKSNLLGLTLLSTVALAIGGAIGLVGLGPWVVKLVYKPSYVTVATSILPWYAGAMIPLSLANVLVNNLLAQSDFRVVPWLVVLAIGYALAINLWHPNLKAVLECMTCFTSIAFLVCSLFTWGPLARGGNVHPNQLPVVD